MAYLMKAKKCDLLNLCDELGIDVGTNKTVAQLIKMIKESDDFDEDFAKSRLEVIKEDREIEIERLEREKENARLEREKENARLEREKEMENARLEREREREMENARLERERDREFELRRLEITSRSQLSSESRSELGNGIRNQIYQNIMPRFDGSGDISIYLSLFEKQISRLNIPRENWVMHLLNLIPLEFVNIISRESESFTDDYNQVKNLLLKRFKLTAEEFRQKFMSHKKQTSANWRDFAFELRNYFDEWIKGMNADSYEKLRDLIIADRIKQNLPYDIQEHFIDQLPSITNVEVLVNKLDDYEAARRSFKKVFNRSSNSFENLNKMSNIEELDNVKYFSSSQNNSKMKLENYNYDYGVKTRDRSKIKCFACNLYGHLAAECVSNKNGRQFFRQDYRQNENQAYDLRNKREANFCNVTPKLMVGLKDILINGKNAQCLLDTGSELNLISYETYIKLGSPELVTNNVKVSGIAKEAIQPLGYFLAELRIDGFDISDNFYVTRELPHEVILGNDVISKLNFSVDENGLKILSKRKTHFIGIVKRIVDNENIGLQKNENIGLQENKLLINLVEATNLNRDRNDYGGLGRLGDLGNKNQPQYNTYGLSPQFLGSLGINGPLSSRVFVSNLDYKAVTPQKLEEVFKLAGKVIKIDLKRDEEGNSKGHGTIEMGHPVEAIQAISMFNRQRFYNRTMSVRMDKRHKGYHEDKRLPEGLQSVGKCLGVKGLPLHLSNPYGMGIQERNFSFLRTGVKVGVGKNMREETSKNIIKTHEENEKQFRKRPKKYKIGDIVAIQRTQFSTGLKLKENYHGPYRVSYVKPNDRYDVERIGIHEGPNKTSSAAEYMKPWSNNA